MVFLIFLVVVLQYMTWDNKIHYFNKFLELSSGFVNTDKKAMKELTTLNSTSKLKKLVK